MAQDYLTTPPSFEKSESTRGKTALIALLVLLLLLLVAAAFLLSSNNATDTSVNDGTANGTNNNDTINENTDTTTVTEYVDAYTNLTEKGYLGNSDSNSILTRSQSDSRYLGFGTITLPSNVSISADSYNDSLKFVAGENVTLDSPSTGQVRISAAASGVADINNYYTSQYYTNEYTTGGGVTSVDTGNGLGGGPITTSGTIALGNLTANWNQTGAFDIVLNNSSSDLLTLGNIGAGTLTAARPLTVNGAGRFVTTSLPSSPVSGDIYNDGTNLLFYNGSSWDDLTAAAGGGGSGTVTNVASGNGLSGGPITSTGTLALGNLTANWTQTGAFDIVLNNASSDLLTLGNIAAGTTTAVRPLTVNGAGRFITTTLPGSPVSGDIYNDGDDLLYFNGSTWDDLTSVGGSGSVTNVASGNGLSGGPITSTGTLALGALTANWNQTGAFDVVLNNSASDLLTLGNVGAGTVTAARPLTVNGAGRFITTTLPGSPVSGDIYNDGTNLLYYNGSTWDDLTSVGSGTVTNVATGNGLGGGPISTTGTIALGNLTADWTQTGAFDIVLNNSSSDLLTLGNIGAGTTTAARPLTVNGAGRFITTTQPSSPVSGDIYNDGADLFYYNGSTWDDLTEVGVGGGGSGTVTNVASGNGLSGGPITNTGTLALGNLTANWTQTGAFDIVLNNSSSDLLSLGNIAAGTTTAARVLTVNGASRFITTTQPGSPVSGDFYNNGTDLFFYNGSTWDDLTSVGTGTVTNVATGNGLSGGPITNTGTVALGNLTANWTQAGAFDIILNNSNSQLRILENGGGASHYGIIDVGTLAADRTYTLPDASGTVALTSDISAQLWQQSGSDIYFKTGKVGIGTDTPTAQLTVENTTAETTALTGTSNSVTINTQYNTVGGNGTQVGNALEFTANVLAGDASDIDRFRGLRGTVDNNSTGTLTGGLFGLSMNTNNFQDSAVTYGGVFSGRNRTTGTTSNVVGLEMLARNDNDASVSTHAANLFAENYGDSGQALRGANIISTNAVGGTVQDIFGMSVVSRNQGTLGGDAYGIQNEISVDSMLGNARGISNNLVASSNGGTSSLNDMILFDNKADIASNLTEIGAADEFILINNRANGFVSSGGNMIGLNNILTPAGDTADIYGIYNQVNPTGTSTNIYGMFSTDGITDLYLNYDGQYAIYTDDEVYFEGDVTIDAASIVYIGGAVDFNNIAQFADAAYFTNIVDIAATGSLDVAGSATFSGATTFDPTGSFQVDSVAAFNDTLFANSGVEVFSSNILVQGGAICVFDGGTCPTLVPGTVYGEFAYNDFDVAENVLALADVQAGDLVSVFEADTEVVRKTNGINDSAMIGVISTNPGALGGFNLEARNGYNVQPITLAGRVPVKVNLEGGVILAGDPISASSTAGVGMKATETSKIIGYAMDNFDGSTGASGTIVVFVQSGYIVKPEVAEAEIEIPAETALTIVQTGDSRLDILEVVDNGVEKIATIRVAKLIVEGALEVVGNVNITGDLFAQSIETEKLVVSGVSTVGEATITAGTTEVIIENTSITGSSIINLTTDQFANYRIKSQEEGVGFTIEIKEILTEDIKFKYFIVN